MLRSEALSGSVKAGLGERWHGGSDIGGGRIEGVGSVIRAVTSALPTPGWLTPFWVPRTIKPAGSGGKIAPAG